MNGLVEFLLAAIAEEEEVARIAQRVPEAAMNITRWHPARVLAECEAKRRIVELARREEYFSGGRSGLGRSLLLALAIPYADRSGFREEWRA